MQRWKENGWRMRSAQLGRHSADMLKTKEGNSGQVTMNPMAKKIAVYVVGWAFVVLGVLGLFLPVLQ